MDDDINLLQKIELFTLMKVKVFLFLMYGMILQVFKQLLIHLK